jgi:predicted transcriptional regulator
MPVTTENARLRSVQVVLRPEQHERLREVARQQDRPVSRVVRDAIDTYFAARDQKSEVPANE